MKQFLSVIVVCGILFSCNSQPSIKKTADSTAAVVDTQRAVTKGSVAYKSDSNRKAIDSTFSKLKDSLRKSR